MNARSTWEIRSEPLNRINGNDGGLFLRKAITPVVHEGGGFHELHARRQ